MNFVSRCGLDRALDRCVEITLEKQRLERCAAKSGYAANPACFVAHRKQCRHERANGCGVFRLESRLNELFQFRASWVMSFAYLQPMVSTTQRSEWEGGSCRKFEFAGIVN